MSAMRRSSDRGALASTIAGFCLFGIAIYLHDHGLSEWGTVTLMFLAGVLVRGESIIGLSRAWRRDTDKSNQPDIGGE